MNTDLLQTLLDHPEPSIRYKARTLLLHEAPDSPAILPLRQEIRLSRRVQTLLSERGPDGRISYHPYQKWRGPHWVLAQLADLGYPPGDKALRPLAEQVLGWLLGAQHQKDIPTIDGRVRRCASQEGNALYALLALGLADEPCDELACRLAAWQWPDGGWNCDRRPQASHASFMESLLPLRGLGLHARLTGSPDSAAAASRAAELFLSHQLYRRSSDGEPIKPDFTELHYPCYWHYDILFALTVLRELGLDADPRCQPAKDVLAAHRLSGGLPAGDPPAGGGYPAHAKYYRVAQACGPGTSLVDWGPVGKNKRNDWVTVQALGFG